MSAKIKKIAKDGLEGRVEESVHKVEQTVHEKEQ